jgi:Vitamin K-dependent gamma-carboxylase
VNAIDRALEQHGSVRAIAVLRIAIGPITLLHLRPFLREARAGESYTDHFWEPFVDWLPELSHRQWSTMLWIGAAAAVLVSAGLCTRVASTVTFTVVAVNLLLSQTHFHHNTVFLAIVLGGVALLPAGRVLSVDAWLRRVRWRPPRPDIVAIWPVWLLRAQLSLVYLTSGVSKLVDPDWFGGLVLWDRMVRNQDVLDPTPLPDWTIDLLTSRWLFFILGPVIVGTEVFVGLGLWFARTRLAAIWMALLFHVAIEISAHVQVFSYAGIAALAVWVTPATRDRTLMLGGDATTMRMVGTLVRAGDWFGRFRVEDVPARSGAPTITVVDRDGSVSQGWSATRLVLSRVPLTFPIVAPLLLPAGLRRLRHAGGAA